MGNKLYFDNRHIKGKVCKDSEVRHGKDKSFTTFSIAINYSEKNGDKWDKIHTEFINCTYFESIKLNKGDDIEVKGYMTYRKYQDKVYNAFKVQDIVGQSANNAQSKNDFQEPDFDDVPF